MYSEINIDHYTSVLGITPTNRPEVLILYGGYRPVPAISDWAERVQAQRYDYYYPLYLGKHRGKSVAVSMTFGSPTTYELTTIFAKIGVRAMVLFGSFGALQPGMRYGEVLIARTAVNDQSFPDKQVGSSYPADTLLVTDAKRHLEILNIPCRVGPIVSTFAMLAETEQMIQDWHRSGHLGVDMETATFYAVASQHGIARVAIHTLADNLIENQTVFDLSPAEKVKKKEIKGRLFEVALDIGVTYVTNTRTPDLLQ